MQFLIINQYSNTKLRKIIYSTDQFTKQLKAVAAYILRQRKQGRSHLQVSRMEITIKDKFKTKSRLVRHNTPILYKRKPQVVYSSQKQCEIDIPRSTLRLNEIAYQTYFWNKFDGRSITEDPDFIKSLYNDKQLRSELRQPYLINGILKYSIKSFFDSWYSDFRYKQRLSEQEMRVVSPKPQSPRKTTRSTIRALEITSNETVPRLPCTVSGNASRRESLKERNNNNNTLREIEDARADSEKNTTVNYFVTGCIVVLMISAIFGMSLHVQPEVFAVQFIASTIFINLLFIFLCIVTKLIRLILSKL